MREREREGESIKVWDKLFHSVTSSTFVKVPIYFICDDDEVSERD